MLIEPVPVQPVAHLKAAHFVAAGGAGMSGIAQLFAESGVRVTGSDQVDSTALRALVTAGVTVFVGHEASHVGDVDVVVVSSAIKPGNVELVEARRRGIPVWHRSAALASLMLHRTGVSVTGTHGKTTTSGMAAVLLATARLDPSYVIGSPLAGSGATAHFMLRVAPVKDGDGVAVSHTDHTARQVDVWCNSSLAGGLAVREMLQQADTCQHQQYIAKQP